MRTRTIGKQRRVGMTTSPRATRCGSWCREQGSNLHDLAVSEFQVREPPFGTKQHDRNACCCTRCSNPIQRFGTRHDSPCSPKFRARFAHVLPRDLPRESGIAGRPPAPPTRTGFAGCPLARERGAGSRRCTANAPMPLHRRAGPSGLAPAGWPSRAGRTMPLESLSAGRGSRTPTTLRSADFKRSRWVSATGASWRLAALHNELRGPPCISSAAICRGLPRNNRTQTGQ